MTGARRIANLVQKRCSTHNLLSTTGRWMRILNATATPPLVYRMEHKANDGMRIHDQKRKLNSSLQPWPEYLMWQWHPLKGCKLPIATHDDFCQALEALQLSRIFIVGDSMQWNMAQSLWKVLSKQPGDPTKVHSKRNGKIIQSQVICGTGSNARHVQFKFFLNNRLTNCTDRSWEGPFEFLPWVHEYVADARPTLLLAHMGAHVHSIAAYEEAMASFMRSVALRNSSTAWTASSSAKQHQAKPAATITAGRFPGQSTLSYERAAFQISPFIGISTRSSIRSQPEKLHARRGAGLETGLRCSTSIR